MRLYMVVEGSRWDCPEEPYRNMELFSTREQAYEFIKVTKHLNLARAQKMWVQIWVVAEPHYMLTEAYLNICGQSGRCMPEDVE